MSDAPPAEVSAVNFIYIVMGQSERVSRRVLVLTVPAARTSAELMLSHGLAGDFLLTTNKWQALLEGIFTAWKSSKLISHKLFTVVVVQPSYFLKFFYT